MEPFDGMVALGLGDVIVRVWIDDLDRHDWRGTPVPIGTTDSAAFQAGLTIVEIAATWHHRCGEVALAHVEFVPAGEGVTAGGDTPDDVPVFTGEIAFRRR
jgi:hypothetical protein